MRSVHHPISKKFQVYSLYHSDNLLFCHFLEKFKFTRVLHIFFKYTEFPDDIKVKFVAYKLKK